MAVSGTQRGQIIDVWVTSLGFGYNFFGKQDECLETDKFGHTAYSLFKRGREFQQQQQAIWIHVSKSHLAYSLYVHF